MFRPKSELRRRIEHWIRTGETTPPRGTRRRFMEQQEAEEGEKKGKYLTWSEVEGYMQATLYNEDWIPIWVYTGLYSIHLREVNVDIFVGIPEVVKSIYGGEMVCKKEKGILFVESLN